MRHVKKIGAMMLAAACLVGAAGMAGCADINVKNPFVEEKPFAATPVPDDFAIIVDRETANYYSREHVQQVVTQQDKMSHTTYRTFRDYNNTLSNSFDSHFPLTPEQLQAMWNEVARNDLMVGGTLWLNSYSDANKYRLSQNQIQIRSNGKIKTYTAANGYPTNMRPLIQQLDSIRLSSGQVNAPLVEAGTTGGAPTAPAETLPAETAPATMSVEKALEGTTTAPTTEPAAATEPTTAPATSAAPESK